MKLSCAHLKYFFHGFNLIYSSWRIRRRGSDSYSEGHRGELSGADGPLECAGHHGWGSGQGRPRSLWNHQQLLLYRRCEFLRNIMWGNLCWVTLKWSESSHYVDRMPPSPTGSTPWEKNILRNSTAGTDSCWHSNLRRKLLWFFSPAAFISHFAVDLLNNSMF